MINVENIKKFKTENKTVLIRFDFNVPLTSGSPISDRINRVIDSIAELKLLNSKIVILSHLGRPKGKINNELSLKQITPQLEQAFDSKITFLDDCIGIDVENKIKNADQEEIILLENCRFYKEEEDNDNNFAKSLSKLADVYINDAFACSHRSHASVAAITNYLPSYCGNLLSEELLNLANVIQMPLSPAITIMGGSKISTKISILKSLSIKMDTIIIVGGMANNFIKYSGLNVQDSLIESDVDDLINQIYEFAEDNNCKIITPIDVITAKEVKKDIEIVSSTIDEIKENNMILDMNNRGMDVDTISTITQQNANTVNAILSAQNQKAEGGIMDLGGMEKDYRAEGGFVPIGREEKADDVPARLSVNEFVFTADAVRNAGGGDIDEGARVMENMMKHLEQGGQVSEESQGMAGARDMFETSERLSEVI